MKKFIINIIILIIIYACILHFVVVPIVSEIMYRNLVPTIDKMIDKQLSELMRDEIIRQLKEKEGKTIRDYYIEDYFRRLKKENLK